MPEIVAGILLLFVASLTKSIVAVTVISNGVSLLPVLFGCLFLQFFLALFNLIRSLAIFLVVGIQPEYYDYLFRPPSSLGFVDIFFAAFSFSLTLHCGLHAFALNHMWGLMKRCK